MIAKRGHQRREQLVARADPVGHRAVAEFDAFACIDSGLPMQRRVVGVLADDDVRQQAGASQATRDRPARRGRLHHAVATRAGKARTHVLDNLEAGRHVLQHVTDIFTQEFPLSGILGAAIPV